MKSIAVLMLLLLTIKANAQDGIKCALYNFKTGKPIHIPSDRESPRVYISCKRQSLISLKAEKDGSFFVPATVIETLGDSIKLIVSGNDFADFEMGNIPKDSIKYYLSKIFLQRAYWRTSGGDDNLVIDNEKTFKAERFLVSADSVRYNVRRVPEKIKQSYLAVKYLTDLKKDKVN